MGKLLLEEGGIGMVLIHGKVLEIFIEEFDVKEEERLEVSVVLPLQRKIGCLLEMSSTSDAYWWPLRMENSSTAMAFTSSGSGMMASTSSRYSLCTLRTRSSLRDSILAVVRMLALGASIMSHIFSGKVDGHMPCLELEGYLFCKHQLTGRTQSLSLGDMPVGSLVGRDGFCSQGLLARMIGMGACYSSTFGADKLLCAGKIEMNILAPYFLRTQ